MKLKECGQRFMSNTSEGHALLGKWGYHGPLVGIDYNESSQITLDGCLAECGPGPDYYDWELTAATITTWILPVIGTLLQAPFESNAFKRTLLALSRWVGSPIASLSYILWNVKINAKLAMMVDMAVKFDERLGRKTDFGSMRDSMYLLLVMNQYSMKPAAALQKEAEGLLRIALFSKDLQLINDHQTLRTKRRKLARELREMRRRGVVPVFISILWFLFAFALSIQSAFGTLGSNSTAHDLALGCLLSWFPVLILCSIVDRNPIATESIRKKLNDLIDHVRISIQDPLHRSLFINTFRDQPEFGRMTEWVERICDHSEFMSNFFVSFAGQARIRWHYGAAHPILSDIENCYIAERGRNWLVNEKQARANLVLGPVDEGLIWFDIREFWQISSAIVIVGGGCGRAFVLSFFTPTVGLGCRSGGYLIFFSIAVGLLVLEMIIWWLASAMHISQPKWVAKSSTRLRQSATFNHLEEESQQRWEKLKRQASGFVVSAEDSFISAACALVGLLRVRDVPILQNKVDARLRRMFRDFHEMSIQRRSELFFFRPLEFFNMVWLIYIVLAQTFGAYRTCYCITSTWGGDGGYLDFNQQDVSNSIWVAYYWTTGTLITSVTMGVAMFYISVEWMQQSWLHTEDYDDAMDGLKTMRLYKHYTYWFRLLSRFLLRVTISPLHSLLLWLGIFRKTQQSLLWTKHITSPDSYASLPNARPDSPSHPHHTHQQPQHRLFPSIELTDFSGPTSHPQSTSLLPPHPLSRPHSLSSGDVSPASLSRNPSSAAAPLLPRFRARSSTDASLHSSSVPLAQLQRHPSAAGGAQILRYTPAHAFQHRDSDASASGSPALIIRPASAHPRAHWTEFVEPVFGEDAASMGGMEMDLGEGRGGVGLPSEREMGLSARAGYRRANSDTDLGPREGVDELGIRWGGDRGGDGRG